jgi:tetratricopeptide (TPR) repeat protein
LSSHYRKRFANTPTPSDDGRGRRNLAPKKQNPSQAALHSLLDHYQNGRYGDAEKLGTSITQQFPHHQLSWKVLGAALNQTGKFQESLIPIQKAVALDPQDAEAHIMLGSTLQELGRLVDAEASHKKAIALKPDFAAAHYCLGTALQKLGRLEDAEASYRKSIALNPGFLGAHINLGNTLGDLGRIEDAKASYRKAVTLKPDYATLKSDYALALWNLYGTAQSIPEAKSCIDECLAADKNHVDAKLTSAALKFYQGDKTDFHALTQSDFKHHALMRSFAWVFSLPKLPSLYFHRWAFFDAVVEQSIRSRPFYEFGVWRGQAFKYLIKTFNRGYGFDTFTGLPEDWQIGRGKFEKAGAYSSDGNIPKIEGGDFIAGKFEDTLPIFFSEPHPLASVINFDADLYSSTICALNYSKSVMDKHTVLIFDQLIGHESWEQDEFKALSEFVVKNNCTYEVVAISFFTNQVAVKLIGI